MLNLLEGHLWWILQITGSMGVAVALTYGMIHGFSWKSFFVYAVLSITTFSWMFLKSYDVTPSFFQAWFVGGAALALLGFFTSKYYFNEVLILPNYIGAAITIIGSALLIMR